MEGGQPSTGLLPFFRVSGMTESGTGGVPWLLDHRAGTGGSKYTHSPSPRVGTGEALLAATLSGSHLRGNTDVQECGDQADIQWGGKEDGRV